MGAWSEDNFGNDDACDWVWGLEKYEGLETLLAPIKSVLNEKEYLESSICSEALAASEIIAAVVSGDDSTLPDEAKDWLNKKQGLLFSKKPQINSNHAKLALEAVNRVIAKSELQELWDEDGENKDSHRIC